MTGAVTAADAALQAGVAPATVRDWARLGRFAPVGRDRRGRPLYDLHDVLEVERKVRQSGRGRPRVA